MRKAIAYAATIALVFFASLLIIPTTSTLPSDYVAYTGFEPPSQCPSSEGYAPNIWEDGNWTTYMLMRWGSTQNRIVQNFTDAGQTIQPKSGGHVLEMHFNQSEAQWNGTEKRDYAHSRLTMHLLNPPFPYYYQSAWYYIPKNWNMSNTEGNENGTDRAWWEFISYYEENRSSPPAPVPDAYRVGGITIGQDSPWNGSQDMFWEVGWGWSSGNETERDKSFSYHVEPDDWWGSKKTSDSIVRGNPHEVPTGRWFRMEFYLYRHETNGIMSFWITDPDNDNASRRETRLLFEIRGEKTFEYRDQTPDEGVNIAKMYMTRNQTQFPTHLWVDEVYVFDYNPRSADVNGDGIADIFDLFIVAKAYGAVVGEPEYNPEADINKDGIVDMQDLNIVCIQYGEDL